MAGEYFIRAAVAADQKQIRALIAEARINPLGLNWSNFLVAEDTTGSIIGVGQVKEHSDGSRELASIATRPGRQRGGVATLLIRELLRREVGVLYLYCESRNRAFYPRFGFYAVTAAELPKAIQPVFRTSQFFAWLARTLAGQELRLVAMRRDPAAF